MINIFRFFLVVSSRSIWDANYGGKGMVRYREEAKMAIENGNEGGRRMKERYFLI